MRLTGSGLDRAEACPGSLALAQHPHDSADADTGRDVHAFLDDAAKRGRALALGAIDDPELAEKCAAIDLDSIPAGAESEVAFAYDPESDTTERLQLDAHRAYPPDDGRIMMTLDKVGILDGAAWVGDAKTGKPGMRAADALQIRAGCLAAARLIGADEAHGALLYLRHDGRWAWDRASFDALDLEAIREQLLEIRHNARRALAIVERGGLPQLVPGLHCEHCAAAVECPVQERQRAALVQLEPQSLAEHFASMEPARRGALVEMAAIVAKKAEQVRETAREYVEANGPIDLPSGRRLAFVEVSASVTTAEGKDELAAKRDELRERGLITTGKTRQLRIVGKARK